MVWTRVSTLRTGQGLPGGYPVRIEQEKVALDLPEGVDLPSAKAFNQRIGTLDGIADIGSDGIVQFTEAAAAAVKDLDPILTEPLDPWKLNTRTNRLLNIISEMGTN